MKNRRFWGDPMPVIKMTDRALKALKAPATGQADYFDQSLPGFGLRVSYGGRKAWILLYRRGQMKRRMTLGTYPPLPEGYTGFGWRVQGQVDCRRPLQK